LKWTKDEDDIIVECASYGFDSTITADAISRRLNITRTGPAVRSRRARLGVSPMSAALSVRGEAPDVVWDKKESDVDWRELAEFVEQGQGLRRKASCSQDVANINVAAEDEVAVCMLGDLHWGSYGADYGVIRKVTDELLEIPGLYAILLGDLEQQSIKMRSVLEMSDNALTPELQSRFTESWLSEVGHKILAACWDNHSVMRQESVTGQSEFKRCLGERLVYFNGIGHINLTVGSETYNIAISHFFRGRSVHNPCYGQRQYMQTVGQDREIAIAGDSHEPGILEYANGNKHRLCVNCGTAQVNSGYAKRFFSLYSLPVFPVIVFSAKRHTWRVFWNLQDYVDYRNAASIR